MPKVEFTDNFNYRTDRVTVAFKKGMKQLVTTDCARKAVAAGRAVLSPEAKTPRSPIGRRRK